MTMIMISFGGGDNDVDDYPADIFLGGDVINDEGSSKGETLAVPEDSNSITCGGVVLPACRSSPLKKTAAKTTGLAKQSLAAVQSPRNRSTGPQLYTFGT